MSYYRKVDCRMHADEKFQELSDPQPCGKYLWVYLLTHKKQQIPGLIEVGPNALAEELKWATDGMLDAFREVNEHGMAHADWDARLVWMPKGILYNWPASINVVKSWGPLWDELPECELKLQAWEAIKAALEPSKAFQVAFLKACPKPSLKASRMPKALPSPIHKHKHKHNTNLDLRIDVDLKTGQVPPPANEVEQAGAAIEPRVVNGLELYGLVPAPEPAVVDVCPPSGTRSAPPPPENASTGQLGARLTPRLAAELSQWPITERVQWLLALYSHERDYWGPQNWPELQAALKTYHDVTGRVGEKMVSYSRCKITRGLLELYAAGRTEAEVCEGIKLVCESDWWRRKVHDGEKLSLGSITPHMFNMAQPGKPVTGPIKARAEPKMGEAGYRRQPDGGATIYDFMAPAEAISG